MRKFLAAVGIVLPALLAVSCGQSTSVYPGSPPSAQAPGQSSAAPGACPVKPVTISEADNGKTICVGTGSEVGVLLHGTEQEKWSRPEADQNQNLLVSKASGKLMIPMGVSGAYFAADHAGTVKVHSSRPSCPATTPGSMSCHSLQNFEVTITIT